MGPRRSKALERHALRTRRAGEEGGSPCIGTARRAAAPYHMSPSEDSPVPVTPAATTGQPASLCTTWSTHWYHEGVPGHHLRASRSRRARRRNLSRRPGHRRRRQCDLRGLGVTRSVDGRAGPSHGRGAAPRLPRRRDDAAAWVVVDIGRTWNWRIPAGLPVRPGRALHTGTGAGVFGADSSRPADFVESELTRYLTIPGEADRPQAGRAGPGRWVGKRPASRRRRLRRVGLAHGRAVAGALGLDDLVDELSECEVARREQLGDGARGLRGSGCAPRAPAPALASAGQSVSRRSCTRPIHVPAPAPRKLPAPRTAPVPARPAGGRSGTVPRRPGGVEAATSPGVSHAQPVPDSATGALPGTQASSCPRSRWRTTLRRCRCPVGRRSRRVRRRGRERWCRRRARSR